MGNLKCMFKNKLILIPIIISSSIFILSFFIGIYLHDVLIPIIGKDIRIDNITIGTVDILKNNMSVFFINIILSIVTFGIYGVIANGFNGVNFGITMGIAYAKFGLRTSLLRILPHGVFEIPTIIISTAVGFMVIGLIISLIRKKQINIKETLLQYVFLVLIMTVFVILAAVIEGQISMNLQ